MLRTVTLESSNISSSALRSSLTSTTSAESMATSVPLPMAMPTSACFNAGESFMPSPTIATFPPTCCRFVTARSLSSGITSDIKSSIPTLHAMARAVFSSSPVSIATRIFLSLSSATASPLPSFKVSATAISASTEPPSPR